MNISQMVRGLVGEARPGDKRTLELKSGQVVRGTIASVSENGRDAVVNINGVPVRAVLETPMQPGQTTWMQVQGQQADGMVIMKPADGPTMSALPSIEEALKEAGLPNETWARRLLHDLQKAGIPMTKELTTKLAQALSLKPPNVTAEEWMQATGVAIRRQLPLTADSVRGLQQALFGKQLTDLLALFERAGDEALGTGNASSVGRYAAEAARGAGWAAPLREAQALVRALLAELPRAEGLPGTGGAPAGAASGVSGSHAQAAMGGSGNASAAAGAGAGLNGSQAASAGNAASAMAGAAEQGASGSAQAAPAPLAGGAWIGRMLSLLGVSHEQQLHRAAILDLTQSGKEPQAAATNQANSGSNSAGTATVSHGQAGANVASNQAPTTAGSGASVAAGQAAATSTAAGSVSASKVPLAGDASSPPPFSVTDDAAGTGARGQQAQEALNANQPQAQRLSQESQAVTSRAVGAHAGHEPAAAMPPHPDAAQPAAPAESLKSTLLQLLQSDNLPPAVREAAQQLVQHVTGQQLLLASDRQAPFSHITLFVPLFTPDGKQTAAVHIQSRQSRRGELDADNCRLWFDLNMRVIGRTLVDVQVVDNAVALNIHHADERLGEWIGGFRAELEAAIEGIGFQLSAFRTLSLPERETLDTNSVKELVDIDDYAAKPYKGVDMRI